VHQNKKRLEVIRRAKDTWPYGAEPDEFFWNWFGADQKRSSRSDQLLVFFGLINMVEFPNFVVFTSATIIFCTFALMVWPRRSGFFAK
jgi:hypothetical protein